MSNKVNVFEKYGICYTPASEAEEKQKNNAGSNSTSGVSKSSDYSVFEKYGVSYTPAAKAEGQTAASYQPTATKTTGTSRNVNRDEDARQSYAQRMVQSQLDNAVNQRDISARQSYALRSIDEDESESARLSDLAVSYARQGKEREAQQAAAQSVVLANQAKKMRTANNIERQTVGDRIANTAKAGAIGSAADFTNLYGQLAGIVNDVTTAQNNKPWLSSNAPAKGYAAADKLRTTADEATNLAKQDLGFVGRLAVDAGANAVQMVGDSIANLIAPGAGLGILGARATGGAAQQARQAGADAGQAGLYGLSSGAVEMLTEKLSSISTPLKGIYGDGTVDGAVDLLISKIKSQGGQTAARFAASVLSEGTEEAISGFINPMLKRFTYDKTATFGKEELADTMYDALVGGVLGGLGGAVDVMSPTSGSSFGVDQNDLDIIRGLAQSGKEYSEIEKALGSRLTDRNKGVVENAFAKGQRNAKAEQNVAKAEQSEVSKVQNTENAEEISETETERKSTVRTQAASVGFERYLPTLGSKGQAAFAEHYDPGDEGFTKSFDIYYEAGLTDSMTFEAAASVAKGRAINEFAARAAFDSGAQDKAAELKAAQAAAQNPQIATALPEKDSGFARNEFSKGLANETINSLDKMAKTLGKKIVAVDSVRTIDGGEANGSNDGKTISFSINVKNPATTIIGHEVGHTLKTNAPTEFAALQSYVMARENVDRNGQSAISRKAAYYGEKGVTIDKMAAAEELTCDFIGDMVRDEATFNSFIDDVKNGKLGSSKQTRNVIQRLIDSIKELLARLKGKVSTAKIVAENLGENYGVEEAEHALKLLNEAMNAAVKNVEQVRKGKTGKGESETRAESVKHSLKTTTSNKPFVVVEQDILLGVSESDWVDVVKDNLKSKFPNGVTIGNNDIRIDDRSRRELTYSKYMQWLYKTNPQLRADKLRATNNADEILQATTGWINEAPHHSRNDTIVSFARGTVLLRIGQNDYVADTIVGTKKNGTMILYDVLNLAPTSFTEKETDAAKSANPSPGTARNTAAISSTSIDSDGENVNEKFSLSEDEAEESAVQYSLVEDKDLLAELEAGETIKVYRAMQKNDGKFYSPMAAKVNGKWGAPIELGRWEQADERPELAKELKPGKWYFNLNKGNGSSLDARYNPYIHTSLSPLNDQFASASQRPNLVIVETLIPASELTSGYKAEKAKDAVGEMSWHSGPVSTALSKRGKERKVILSRYDKPIREVPVDEVAGLVAKMLEGEDIAVPSNVVTPKLKDALMAHGVKVSGGNKKYSLSEEILDADGATSYNEKQGAIKLLGDKENMPSEAREWSAFNRSFANKTSGIKAGEEKTIIIFTADNMYRVAADGYMSGYIKQKIQLDDDNSGRETKWRKYYGVNKNGKVFDRWFEAVRPDGRRTVGYLSDAQNRSGTSGADELSGGESTGQRAGSLEKINRDYGEIQGVDDETFLPGSLIYDGAGGTYRVNESGQPVKEKFSLSEDSKGNKLTEGQAEYFKDSKAVDDDGRLLTLYHGTRKGGFTVFKDWTYLTAQEDYAERYADKDTGETMYEVYAKIINPFDTRLPECRAIFENESLGNYSNTPLQESSLPDWTDGYDLVDFFEEHGYSYDAILLDEGADPTDNGTVSERGISYVVRSSNQIKRVDNLNPTENEDIRYSLSETYQDDISQWDKDDRPEGETFILGATGDVLQGLGAIENDIYVHGDKINRILADHPEMTLDEIRRIPEILEDPVLILKSRNVGRNNKTNTRLVMFGAVKAKNNQPVLTVLDLRPIEGNFIVDDMQKVNSAYIKDNDPVGYVTNSDVLFADKKRTKPLLRSLGFQMPSALLRHGSIGSIDYTDADVNISGVPFESIFSSADYSLAGTDVLAENRELREQVSYLKKQMTVSTVAETDSRKLAAMTKKLLREYSSEADAKEVTDKLQALYDMMANNPVWDDIQAQAQSVAKTIVDEAVARNDEMYNTYADLRTYFHNTGITLDPTARGDIREGWNDFRKRNFGRLKLVNDGIAVDVAYHELAEIYPEFFDESVNAVPADQLQQIADVLESLAVVYENPYSGTMATAQEFIANDIIERFYDVPQSRTFADKAELKLTRQSIKDANKLEAERTKHKERMDKLREKYSARLEKAIDREKQRRENAVEKVVNRYQSKEARARERQNKSKLKGKIKSHVLRISKMLLSPTETSHVPEYLRQPVAEVLSSIDLTNDRVDTKAHDKLLTLQAAYSRLMGESAATMEVDPDLIENLKTVIDGINGKTRVTDMSIDELNALYRSLLAVERSIYSANRAFNDALKKRVSEMGYAVMAENKADKGYQAHGSGNGIVQAFADLLNMDTLAPADFFEEMGVTMEGLYAPLRQGLDRKIELTKVSQEYMRELKGDTDIKAWTGKGAKLQSFTLESGETVQLSPAQMMALYLHSRQSDAMNHIYKGGIRPASVVVVKNGKAEVVKSYDVAHVTPADVGKIIGALTEKQKQIAEGISKFFTDYTAKWGNEVSLQLYGYKKFGIKNYFPIVSDSNYIDTVFGEKTDATLKNAGFTKSRIEGANNPIILEDVFDVFARQSDKMASYNAFVIPLSDIQRVFNFKSQNGSVKASIEKKFGVRATQYFKKFMTDVNGGAKKEAGTNLSDKLIGNYKAAAVGLNLRVVAQQPTAYFRALSEIDPKYLLTPFGKTDLDTIYKYAPIAQWKDWGYFNMDTGKNMTDLMLGKKTLSDVTMWAAGKMDTMTWRRLWAACERQTRAEQPALMRGSEAYYKAVGAMFSRVIDRTQVVDSTFHRPQIMRNNNTLVKMSTAFMSEPMKSYNMLRTAARNVRDGKVGAKKHFARAAFGYIASVTINSAVTGLIDTLRGDDDDEKNTWLRNFLQNLLTEAPSMIPYVKDVVSIAQGYDVARMDWQGVNRFVTAIKYALSDKYTTQYKLIELTSRAADLCGVPATSLKRDITTFAKMALNAKADPLVDFEVTKALYRIDTNSAKYLDILYDAYKAGNTRAYDIISAELIAAGKDATSIEAGMKSRAKKDAEFNYDSSLAHRTGLQENFNEPKEETEEKYGVNSLTGEQYVSYSARMADVLDDVVAEFPDGQDDEMNERLLDMAYKYAESTAMTEASEGQYVEDTKWILNAMHSEDYGLSASGYIQFTAAYNTLEAIKDKDGEVVTSKQEQVWDYINHLPITKSQKDKLHLVNYKESSLEKTPWH